MRHRPGTAESFRRSAAPAHLNACLVIQTGYHSGQGVTWMAELHSQACLGYPGEMDRNTMNILKRYIQCPR